MVVAGSIVNLFSECARRIGRYVAPDSFVPTLAPRVSGDLEVSPGGIDADQRAA